MSISRRIATALVFLTGLALASPASAANIFNFKGITNGGANRFWVNDQDQFFRAGSDVAGRPSTADVNVWLEEAAVLYNGSKVSQGNVNCSNYPSASQVQVQDNGIVKLAGDGVGGQYRYGFNSVEEAENFAVFFRAVVASEDQLLCKTPE
ncbi:MAG: hypothetical protein AAGF97_15975 [Planctomycetota bacterium]